MSVYVESDAVGRFVHGSWSQRILFGLGARHELSGRREWLPGDRAFMIVSSSAVATADEIAAGLNERCVGRFPRTQQHVPDELANEATDAARAAAPDSLLSVGGGSATGLAKVIAVRLELPLVAIPTTYAGSEMTPIWAVTKGTVKSVQTDVRALPRAVVYDPEATLGLPPRVTACSGLNAMAQAVASVFYSPLDRIAVAYAERAFRELSDALRVLKVEPDNLSGRSKALLGACLAAKALAATGTGLHHRICHVMGGRVGVTHAEAHAILLPHTTAHMARAMPGRYELLRELWGPGDPAESITELADEIEAPKALRELGLDPHDYPEIVNEVVTSSDIDRTAVMDLLLRAHSGARPI